MAPDGRVMEMLSEHTLEVGSKDLLTGRMDCSQPTRHSFTYRFDVQPTAKWLEKSKSEIVGAPDLVGESVDHVDVWARITTDLHRTWLPGHRDQQKPGRDPHLFCLPTPTAC